MPVAGGSIVDLVATLNADATVEDINQALREAADGELKGLLGYTDDPVVSIDFNHCPLSSIADLGCTKVLEGRMVKVLSWYDNEWGYSCRCVDLAKQMAAAL